MPCTGIVSRGKSAFVDGFELFDVKLLNDITLRVAMGGGGDKTPLLMVHGHPHTHVIWRKVAPAMAQDARSSWWICAATAIPRSRRVRPITVPTASEKWRATCNCCFSHLGLNNVTS